MSMMLPAPRRASLTRLVMTCLSSKVGARTNDSPSSWRMRKPFRSRPSSPDATRRPRVPLESANRCPAAPPLARHGTGLTGSAYGLGAFTWSLKRAEADMHPRRVVGLLTNPVAHEVAQPRPSLEVGFLRQPPLSRLRFREACHHPLDLCVSAPPCPTQTRSVLRHRGRFGLVFASTRTERSGASHSPERRLPWYASVGQGRARERLSEQEAKRLQAVRRSRKMQGKRHATD